MSNVEIKKLADTLSDIYIENEDDFLDAYEKCPDITNVRDGYIVGRLCDVYREAKTGVIDRDTARERQNQIFEEAKQFG